MKVELQHVLKRELKNRNLTTNGLARSCRIPASVLHSWIQGVLPSAKNLHHIAALSKCLDLPISVLLFNENEGVPEQKFLFRSEFSDDEDRYHLSVEKIHKGEAK